MKFVGAVCCGLVVLAVVVALVSTLLSTSLRSRVFGRRLAKSITRTCIACEGRGWVVEQRRSLDFDGTRFAEPEQTTRACERCGGSGTVSG